MIFLYLIKPINFVLIGMNKIIISLFIKQLKLILIYKNQNEFENLVMTMFYL